MEYRNERSFSKDEIISLLAKGINEYYLYCGNKYLVQSVTCNSDTGEITTRLIHSGYGTKYSTVIVHLPSMRAWTVDDYDVDQILTEDYPCQ